jgi:UDP-galactopyranose mutase
MKKSLLTNSDVVCFSHLRWKFVFQRPQHLMTRFAKANRVFFIEEPICDTQSAYNEVTEVENSVWIVVPHIPAKAGDEQLELRRALLDVLINTMDIQKFISWYYTPTALQFSRHLNPLAIVYDCMDELSAFRFAPPELKMCEKELMNRADIVFTGGYSLFEAKQDQHQNMFAFPSSIDKVHFAKARFICDDTPDQAAIPHPRIGFYGVIDERFNMPLLEALAELRHDWHFIIIGPTAKIDESTLPSKPNIHFLGAKSYADLPRYLAGWDVAMMPFALNEATRYISPTKTPEYLAGGKPVVSTSIQDVVAPYGKKGLVYIADTVTSFSVAIEKALETRGSAKWLHRVDQFLGNISWDKTFRQMFILIEATIERNRRNLKQNTNPDTYV